MLPTGREIKVDRINLLIKRFKDEGENVEIGRDFEGFFL